MNFRSKNLSGRALFPFLFIFPTYAFVRIKFFTHFRFVRPINGNTTFVTNFLAFIARDIIVSFSVAINKLRLSNSLLAII